MDPIEKKPLFHYYPGEVIFSIGGYGCSFSCPFCQNYNISRVQSPAVEEISPQQCVESALESGSKLLAFTYNEPYINYEYLLETSKIAYQNGLKNVLVTNGYYETEPWEELSPFIDAMNIDLKGTAAFYKKLCLAEVEPVLKTIQSAFLKGIHLEVTMLVIPDENDSTEAVDFVIDFIASVSKDIPLHFSRYFPQYKMTNPPTTEKSLIQIYQRAKQKLNHVYLGNVLLKGTEDTFCPSCKELLIERTAYHTHILKDFIKGRCNSCKTLLYGRFH